jgi:hypothetical protein
MLANVRPGRKCMELANTLAYYYKATIMAMESFIEQVPGYFA